jgi:thiamine kinase-like enzyme
MNKTITLETARPIFVQFDLKGAIKTISPFGSGHIHDTYRLTNEVNGFPDYILQRINHNIFKNIPGLTENMRLVTAHLKKRLAEIPGSDPEKEVLQMVPMKNGQYVFQDADGNHWRVFHFLKDTRSYDLVTTEQQAFEGGKAFGKFQRLLADMDATRLQETIPDFHNLESRMNLFHKAIEANPKDRVKLVAPEIEFVESRVEQMNRILKLGRAGKLPLRITHNDTKFNNVLLDQNDRGQCVIDLDTVMPGYVAYDFGDAVRTIVNTASEDEKDLEKIQVNMALLKSFAEGFLSETAGFLNRDEVDSLAMGVLLLPFIMGLRFLTDYIGGDTYYKIHFPEHNIQRARAQFRLVEKLEEQYPEIQRIITNCI